MTRPLGRLRCLGVFLFLLVAPVFGQESESSPADSATGWVFRWLNFAIVLGVIAYFAIKKGAPYFRKRAEEISQKIRESTRTREAAEEQRREAETKIAGLDKTIAEMHETAKRDAEAERQRLQALARDEAEKIEQAAQEEIAAAERAARLELKVHAARLALEGAASLLRQTLTPQAEEAIFRTFVEELERSLN
jgi:F-type H+-transporting ATPase subunit b